MRLKELIKRAEAMQRRERGFKPHIPSSEWVNWIWQYLTPEEADEINWLCAELEKLPDLRRWDSCEAYKLRTRMFAIEAQAEDRAILEPVNKWPECLRDQADEYREAIQDERLHPND
jgi:hypothetical protein